MKNENNSALLWLALAGAIVWFTVSSPQTTDTKKKAAPPPVVKPTPKEPDPCPGPNCPNRPKPRP